MLVKNLLSIKIFRACCLISLIAIPLYILYLMAHWWVSIPFWDEVGTAIPQFQDYLNNQFSGGIDLWGFHNEHRIIIINLLYLGDYLLAKGNYFPIVILSFITQLLLWLFLSLQARKLFPTNKNLLLGLSVCFMALAFAPQMLGVWFLAASIGHPLTALFFTLAVFLFAQCVRNNYSMWWPLVPALLGTAVLANGLLIWPTLVLMALILRAPWRYIWVYSVVGLAVILLYAHGMPTSSLAATFHESLYNKLRYFFIFIGSAFGLIREKASFRIGLFGTFLYGMYCYLIYCKSRSTPKLGELYPWFFISLLTFSSAAIGAVGRTTFTPAEALSDRYICLSILFWISLAVHMVYYHHYVLVKEKSKLQIVTLLLSGFLMSAFLMTAITPQLVGNIPWELAQQSASLKNNVYIPNLMYGKLNPDIEFTLKELNFLKQHQLAPFTNRQQIPVIGQYIKNLNLTLSPKTMPGAFTQINTENTEINTCTYGFSKGLLALGWVMAPNKFIERVYIVDKNSKIYGIAFANNDWRFHPRRFFSNKPRHIEWSGFVAPTIASPQPVALSAYVKFFGSPLLYKISGEQSLTNKQRC